MSISPTTPPLSLEDLTDLVASGGIDTVIVGFTDHYGRTMGKVFDADFFLDSIDAGTHVCNYLLTVDMEMDPVEGYESANWDQGYSDVHLVPDLATLRMAGWKENTAFVLCDVYEGGGSHDLAQVAPRSILRTQINNAKDEGYEVAAASELEFFLFRDSYREANDKGYRDLKAAGWYVEDYHLLQAARVEDYVGAARAALKRSGVPVENSKGEAALGQHELNIRYTEALTMADRHVVMKQGMKELADSMGVAVSFMAKPDASQPGNSCHIHMSLWKDGQNVFAEKSKKGEERSDLFRWFLGGWMTHLADLMPFYAPTINSYKRYQDESWAPTRIAWSTDNRTAGFRIIGTGSSLRIENRIAGGDANPYLVYAASIASGLDGIANKIEPPPELTGNAYAATDAERVPPSLAAAVDRFANSSESRRLLGDTVVDHYSHFFASEVAAFDAAVTDWELKRYFERI